jgi:MFS family permease
MTREFWAYFLARQGALFAFSIEDVAVSWQIFQLRHSAFDLGLVGLVLFLPQLVLALPAGVLADRVDRRLVCITFSLAEAAGLAGFIVLIALHVRSLGIYLAAVAFIGIAHATVTPAQRSLLATIVPRERFVRAQALTSSVGQLITVAGPAAGGALIAISTPAAFVAAAAAYIAATAAFAFLSPHRAEHRQDEPVMRAALKGLHFIFQKRLILGAISLDLFAVLFGGATALLPVFATNILHVGPQGFGILRAAPALGAAIVAGYVARRSLDRGAGRLLLFCVAGFGLATIVFGISRSFMLSIAALAFTGAFDMVSVVIRNALVQLGTPDEMRGRVGAVENVFIGASNELGAFESGGVAALIGAQASVVLGGIATIAVILLWSVLFPELRRFEMQTTP